MSDAVCVQFVLDQGSLPMFHALLTHHKNSIQKEAAWMISNVTAGNASQIQAVIDHGLIPLVIDIIAKVTALCISYLTWTLFCRESAVFCHTSL